jgi:glycosyltransferase involved in cell wall biosynthesis
VYTTLLNDSNQKVLTIAIPTYNRPNQIQTQLRLLLPQLNESLCMVIYDNCSDIAVQNLFTEDELSKFQIIRNRVNVGGDANIARCFENCTTKWLWTLSDDDYIKENAVEIVLNEISKNSDAVFINFNNNVYFKTVGFEKLSYKFRNDQVYSSSFTMSRCIYNISKLQPSLIDYYNYLSSMVGSLILVLRYVQRNNDALCIFTDVTPICKFNNTVGWNYRDYINRNKLFIDAFGGKSNREMNKTLFIGCHKTSYNLIIGNRKESKISYLDRWKTFHQTIKNQGLCNAFKYTPKRLIYTFLCLVLKTSFTIGFLSKVTYKKEV